MRALRTSGSLSATLGAASFILYLWLRYFSPKSPVAWIGILGFFLLGIGAFLLLGELVPRRWRSPAQLLRWNTLLSVIGVAYVLVWELLGLAASEDQERLFALLRGFMEVGIAAQAAGHLALAGHLLLGRLPARNQWIVLAFFGFSAGVLFLRIAFPTLDPYLSVLLWISLLPLLYYSYWLIDLVSREFGQTVLLLALQNVALFVTWQVLPGLFSAELPPLYLALYPLLLATLFLHAGWLLLPFILRIFYVSQSESSYSLELLTEFLARQQRAANAREILQIACQTFEKIAAVRGVLAELRIPLEEPIVVTSLAKGYVQDAVHALLHQRSGTEVYTEVVPSLQKFNRRLPNLSAFLIQRPISLLRGSVLSQTLSIGVLSREPDGFDERDLQLLSTLAEQTALFLENLDRRLYQEQALTARKEADFMRETREALLPPPPPLPQKVDLCVVFEQYDRTIGGDYYQVHEYPDGHIIDFWLSDCAGSGIAAAYQMAQARGALNTLWLRHLSPDAFILELNDALKRVFHKNNFLAATLLRFDLEKQEYVLLRAGNPEVFYWNPLTRKVDILRPSGIVLGNASSQIISRILVPERGKLVPGSLFMCFSDGFTEATNAEGEMFGVERLLALFEAHHDLPTREIADKILQAVRAFTGGSSLGDDGTLLLARYTG